MNNIGFIGLGKLGLIVAETFAKKGFNVKGYDIKEVTSDQIDIVNSIENVCIGQDIIFIAVQTPHNPFYDGSMPTSAVFRLSACCNANQNCH